jgi:hypothetical protein
MARFDPSLDALPGTPTITASFLITDTNHVPLRTEGGIKRKIFRLLGIGSNRKPTTTSAASDVTPPQTEKRRLSRILGLGNDHNTDRDADRLQHVRESKVRQPIDPGDAGSISFSATSLQNSERTGGGAGSPVVGTSTGAAGGILGNPMPIDSMIADHDLGKFDSSTTSNTSTHSPLETATSNKPPSTMSQNTAATSFSHPNRPISATPIFLPPHLPASPTAPSTSSLYPRLTDDASVLTLASSSKRIRRRNSFDTNASMLAIAPSSRRDSQESLQEYDDSEPSISGARRSAGSVLSSKFEGGRARSIATGHSVRMGEEDEEDEDEGKESQSFAKEFEKGEKEAIA